MPQTTSLRKPSAKEKALIVVLAVYAVAVIGLDTFGESAPAGALFKHFGITAEAVADAVRRVLA